MWEELAQRLLGTCTTGVEEAALAGVDLDRLESEVAHCGVERCTGCGWWHETWELNEDYECEECAEE